MGRKVGWKDGNITSGGKEDRYKAEAGRTDVICVMTDCEELLMHWTGKFNAQCAKASADDETDCPNCDAYGAASAKPRYGCLIIHLAVQAPDGKFTLVGKPMYWGFGADKYKKLFGIDTATKGKLMERDLLVTCEDTQFQKLTINAREGVSILQGKNKKKYASILKAYEAKKGQLYKMFMEQKTPDELRQDQDDSFPAGDDAGAGAPDGDGGGGGDDSGGSDDGFDEAHSGLLEELE